MIPIGIRKNTAKPEQDDLSLYSSLIAKYTCSSKLKENASSHNFIVQANHIRYIAQTKGSLNAKKYAHTI